MFSVLRKLVVVCVIILSALLSGSASAGTKLVVVDFSEATISFYDENDKLVAQYPVVLPLPAEAPPKLPVRGTVVKIEKNPYWYPTKRSRDYFLEHRNIRLPKVVRPNDPLNSLGTMRISVRYIDPIKPTSRIHGTNEPKLFLLPPVKRHRSGGCIRMQNQDAEALGNLILSESKPVRVVLRQ